MLKTSTLISPQFFIAEPQKKFYHDKYANISLVDSIPCIKVKLNGVPQSSDHYQLVNTHILDSVHIGKRDYFRLHLLTDCSKAGFILNEDAEFYKNTVVPGLEKAGIRYHAVILPENHFLRIVTHEIFSTETKVKTEFFNTLIGASKWLRGQ